MRTLVEEIRNARQSRQLPQCFRASDVEKVCPGRARRAYRDYLSRHREDNPGGHPPYFRRNVDGSYSLIKEQEPPNAAKELDEAAAAQWILSVPFDVRPGLDFQPQVIGTVRGYDYVISRLDDLHQIKFEDLPSVIVAQQFLTISQQVLSQRPYISEEV